MSENVPYPYGYTPEGELICHPDAVFAAFVSAVDEVGLEGMDTPSPALVARYTALRRGVAQPGCNHHRRGAYAAAALKNEIERVLETAEGSRNDQLNRSSFALGQLVGSGLLELDEVVERLCQAGTAVGLGAAEIVRTVQSGVNAGLSNPRPGPA